MCKQTGNCQRRRVMAALTPASPPKIEFDKRCVFVADKLSRKSRQHFSPIRFLSAFTPADFNCSFYFDGVRQGSTPHIFNWRVCWCARVLEPGWRGGDGAPSLTPTFGALPGVPHVLHADVGVGSVEAAVFGFGVVILQILPEKLRAAHS